MADLTAEGPLGPDLVTCTCGEVSDRNIYAQCPKCPTNLWDPNLVVEAAPAEVPIATANTTVLEGAGPSAAGIDIIACGRRLRISDGQTLRLGRHEEFETADMFRAAPNVSRVHAILRLQDGALHVTDTRSSNGTYVDGQRLPSDHEYELRQGQALRLASDVAIDILWERQ
ncbi:FHA domain-containing protein [Mycobacterium sp. MBM]|nr:FHA domain-containing protein [Mycobacterium sp. MBM]